MNITCIYHPNESIALTLNNFDPFDEVCQKVQAMLESKKFIQQTPLHYARTQFNNDIKTESFDFWLEQAEKLCQKFGGNEVVGVVSKEPASLETTDSLSTNSLDNIVQQLLQKVTLLEQEVASLKKYDLAASEKLKRLNQQLGTTVQ